MPKKYPTTIPGLRGQRAQREHARRLVVAEVAADIMSGKSVRSIALERGMTQDKVRLYRDETLGDYKREADEQRMLWTARSEKMLEVVWERAISGDDRAIDHVIKLMNAANRYWRFDPPVQATLTQNNMFVLAGSDTELAKLGLAELRALAAAEMKKLRSEVIEGEVIDGSAGSE